jgi:hypothetical protein
MNQYNTFTYLISSANRLSGTCNDCEIEIGPVSENYDKFYCKCIGFNFNVDVLTNDTSGNPHPAMLNLVVEDFADNGYSTSFKSNQMPIAWISCDNANGFLSSGEGAQFLCKNLRQKRRLKFKLYGESMTLLNPAHLVATSNWFAVLLFQPII